MKKLPAKQFTFHNYLNFSRFNEIHIDPGEVQHHITHTHTTYAQWEPIELIPAENPEIEFRETLFKP